MTKRTARGLRARSIASGARRVGGLVAGLGTLGALLGSTQVSRSAEPPSTSLRVSGAANGIDLVRRLGSHASETLAPTSGVIGALVAIPPGARGADLGVDEIAPGIGRLRATAEGLDAFALAHPGLRLEVAPPLHTLLDKAGQWVMSATARQARGADGRGVLIGVADTGVDVTHPDMLDAQGHSRVAWLLDLSLKPLGVHKDLEAQFAIKDREGNAYGAVLDAAMIDAQLAAIKDGTCVETSTSLCTPIDEVGHGTHVAGIAASSGNGDPYPGMAPAADVVFVRVTRANGEGIENDDLVNAVRFMFDRADAAKKPMVVNLSLGSDFGPHDGSFLWEQAIASFVGPAHPGRAIVAAAGNSGSILESPIHQSVSVTRGARARVPVRTGGADRGAVQIWVTLRPGADIAIGLEGPDGEWIVPQGPGEQRGKNTSDYNAAVIYGGAPDSPVPTASRGAVVIWSGKWPSGTYQVTLEGSGVAELYLQGLGDSALGSQRQASFTHGVREGTINLPATHPSIIGVGCTVNRARWISQAGTDVGLRVPLLDPSGGLPVIENGRYRFRDLEEGEICWFSSAGPSAAGVPKPEIAAPGALVVSAVSRTATPDRSTSIFNNPSCPDGTNGTKDPRCLLVDDQHGIAVGTSMSSPMVAGVVALLLQRDPTLTQDKVVALLQGGAHRFRGSAPYGDQSSPGEVDAVGALDALDLMQDPKLQLPSAGHSWLVTSSDWVAADGSTPLTAIVELRTEDGAHRADFFDASRLAATVTIDGEPVTPPPTLTRRGPGVWFYSWTPPRGRGGGFATFGATFDGAPITAPRTLPIATDRWNSAYPSHGAGSGCGVGLAPPTHGVVLPSLAAFGLIAFAGARRRRRA